MSAVLRPATYPAAIEQKLRQVRRRQCALAIARAVLLGVAALLAVMLAAMTIDWCFTLLSTTVRLLLTTAACGAAAATLLLAAVRPVITSLALRRAAGDVDQALPQLEERWTTVANFVEVNHRPRSAMGKAMLRQVTSEAVALDGLVEPARVATPRQLQRAGVLFAAASIVIAAFLAVDWQHHRVLLRRFWSPLSDVTATRLESITGDVVSPRGEPLEIVVRRSGLPRERATISLAWEGMDDTTAELIPSDDQPALFTYYVAMLESSFRYRVQAGDGRTQWHAVTAIDHPALADVRLSLKAPEYVDRPAYEKDYLPDRVRAVQGSRLRLEMRPEADVASFELVIGRKGKSTSEQGFREADEERLVILPDGEGWYRYEAVLEEDVALSPALISVHGLKNQAKQECRIRVIPDRAPVARVISPTEDTAVSPDETVEVKFEAHDDHGIAKAELVVYEESVIEGESPTVLSVDEVPLGDQENAAHVVATAELDLSKYDLHEGSSITFAIRVTDNRFAMSGPTTGEEQEQGASEQATSLASSKDQQHIPKGDDSGHDMTEQEITSTSETPDARLWATNDGQSDTDSQTITPPNGEKSETFKHGTSSGESKKLAVGGTIARKQEQVDREPSEQADIASREDANASSASGYDPANSRERGSRSDSLADTEIPRTSTEPAASAESSRVGALDAANASEDSSDAGSTTNVGQSGAEPTALKDEELPKPIAAAPKSTQPPQLEAASRATVSSSLSTASRNQDARESDEMQRDNQSDVSGDLASAEPRSRIAEDLRGQFTESNRLRLEIEERLTSAGEPGLDRETIQMTIRQRLEQIDRELKPAEEVLAELVDMVSGAGIADPQIQELKRVDGRLATVDRIIADLRNESKETPYAFAGLHMVEVGVAHITPARDRVFALIQQPDVDTHGNAAEALHRVSRSRELLAELLARYERVLREEKLAEAIEDTATIYAVYVENLHRFLRAQSKPNPNPLNRQMEIVEVDQEYLDRLREVTEMRRDLMAEFARMLADDPRLLSKYMDLLKRRQTSLRDRLTELHERQQVIATELSGWLRVDQTQREDVWMLAAEIRLQDVAPLAREASRLEERTASQFPLGLDPGERVSAAVLKIAKQVAVRARTAAAKARRLLRDPFDESVDLASDIDEMEFLLSELDAALEQLGFDTADEETVEYVDKRLAEGRTLSERVLGWTEMAEHLQARRFDGLAKVDQQQLALRTELLRIDMEGINEQLDAQFRGEVPQSVTALASKLKQIMEAITFNQAAATFELESDRLRAAETQQALALEGFERADELFDEVRRRVIEELDQIDPPDPNIADLEDPTLDELLERLEREPDLSALLGLPNRPRNLRVMSDFLASADGDIPVPEALEQASQQARQRAKEQEEEARRMRRETDDTDMTEEEWREVADAEEAQEKLEEKIAELKRQADDPRTEPEDAARLRQMAEQLEQMRQQLAGRQINDQQWQEMVRSDQMRAIMRASATGEPLPDSQWNQLMSSLDDGLWQVRRRTPPDEYRQAIQQYQDRIRKLMNVEAVETVP